MSVDRMPTGRGITPLADIPDGELRDGELRDGGPELVISGEHPLIPVPVLPRRRHEIGQPVQEVTRQLHDNVRIPGVEDLVKPVKEYRLVIRFRVDGLVDNVADTDPLQTG